MTPAEYAEVQADAKAIVARAAARHFGVLEGKSQPKVSWLARLFGRKE